MTSDQPLLTLRNNVSIRYEMVTSASIAADSLPIQSKTSQRTDSVSSYSVPTESVDGDRQSESATMARIDNRGDSRKVNYVLVMDVPKTAQLQAEILRVTQQVDCCGMAHVNQTHYRPVENSLIAVSIETKPELP
ncbi:hypothetical protein SCUP515_12991 [Seiridium cupressi]